MSEIQSTYATNKTITEPAGEPLPCPTCGWIVGEICDLGTGYRVYLTGSSMPLYAVHGECPECGGAVHWTNNDETLKRILKRRRG